MPYSPRRMMRTLAFFLAVQVVLNALPANAQDPAPDAERDGLTGRLQTDVLYTPGAPGIRGLALPVQAGGRGRIIPLAFGLSAVVPGAGQVYNRNFVKAAVAVGLEAAILGAYFTWKNRGEEGEEAFQAYAHAHWSPLRYAEWLNGYTGNPTEPFDLPPLSEADFMRPENWTQEQRREVDAFFRRIRAAEEASVHIETGAVFSHVLPFFGEQQYYELIGKYFQYAPGWDDYNGANDPEESGPDGGKVNVPRDSRFYRYAADHADANTWLRRASRLTGVLLLNHFLAAIDAAVSAKLHNDRLRTGLSLRPTSEGGLAATARLEVTL